jgi:DNA-binding SARP family transcriptional activator
MLSILLLGPPQIARDGAPVNLPRRRARALVYYLAAQPAPVRRDQLLALLWPDHERGAAQQILRSTLHSVRRAIGPALAGDDPLAIAPDADVDHRDLSAVVSDPHAGEAELAAALERYHDDFLAGFELADAEPFEEWLFAERERTRLLATRGLARLARLREARADYEGALSALRRALALDALQEDLQRDAIRLHYLAGDRVGAIRRYEQLRDLLDAEIGVPPMRETQALYDAIVTDTLEPGDKGTRGGGESESLLAPTAVPLSPRPLGPASPRPRAPAPPTLPFTGRDAELARLEEATAAGRLALIEGEAGIGKTRLSEEFGARGARAGGLALVGVAHELEHTIPYQPILDALRHLTGRPEWPALRAELGLEPLWLGEAARLLPDLAGDTGVAPLAGRPDEARLWESIARLLLALARRSPVTLVLDDLHWADASTLGLLGYLLRRVAGAPLRILATARPAEPRSPLASLLAALTREGRLERLALRRLGLDEMQALARSLAPYGADILAAWLQRNAEGNPYIIDELVRLARAERMLTPAGVDAVALSTAPVVPQSVYSLIAARLARLSDEARRVLDTAVAAGRDFEFEVVARAAALSESAALDALDELRAARFVEPVPGGAFRFDHTLTMEVAYREVGEPRHRALHRRLAEALEALHRDRLDEVAGLIASHLAEGGAPDRAAAYALRAGRRAASVAAWAEAVAFYEQALAGAAPAERPAVLWAGGAALLRGGAAPPPPARYREAMLLARTPAELRQARQNLARTLIPQGRYGEVIELARALLADGHAERWHAFFLWGTALSLEGADLAEAALRLGEAERIVAAQPDPDPVALAQVRFELGSVAAQQGDLPRAVAYYHEALAVADGAADDQSQLDGALTWRILARNNLAYHLLLLGDLGAAGRYADEGVALAEERGAIGMQPYLCSTSGEIALARGDLDGAEAAFTAGLDLAERLHIPERVAGITANLGLLALRRGHAALAIHRLSAALATADALGTRHLAAQVRVWLAPLLPPAEARAALAEARAIAESGGRQRLQEEIARAEAALAARSQAPGAG